jgi:L-asparaginase
VIAPDLPGVVVVFTGGTIATLPDPTTGAAVPALRGADILARTPGLGEVARVEAVDWGLVPASHLRFGQIIEVGAIVRDALARPGIGGAVIVQGTDVMEETAFAWDLLLDSSKPVAVTGAMRGADHAEPDGPVNLRQAVRSVVEPLLVGQGVFVVMGGLVLAADEVAKTHSLALDAFQSPDGGPIARFRGDHLERLRERGPRRRLPHWPSAAAEPIALVTAVVSTDGDQLRAAVAAGARGIVVEATGSGNTDPDLLAAASEAMAEGIPVALVTRCASGPVGPFYGFPGGGATWQAAGAILGGGLSGPKARVALALGIGAGLRGVELARLLGG